MKTVKKRYVLKFPPQSGDKPLSYVLVKEYDISINILKAEVIPGKRGNLLLELEGKISNIKKGIKYLETHQVECDLLDKKIKLNQNKCINCGNCTAVCFAGALSMHPVTWELQFNKKQCIVCELCLNACPMNLFEIDFHNEN
ncbi:MAG: 4Fe-4S binding protein [Prolixibacteraceae bacterium]|jgi:ferredoxin|nr:4Fe-4S binding protein [Prolixibacteraceae bacterium]